MPRSEKGSLAKKALLLNPHKINELRRLLKAETEDEAVRTSVEGSVMNRRIARSLTRFLDVLAREQAQAQQ
jgi:hypothetical protein